MFGVQTTEALLFFVEKELYAARWPVTVLFDQQVSDAFAVGFRIIIFLAVNKGHNIGILFDRT